MPCITFASICDFQRDSLEKIVLENIVLICWKES